MGVSRPTLGWTAKVALVGESALHELKTGPDFAVTRQNLLVGFIEIEAPGKGAREPMER